MRRPLFTALVLVACFPSEGEDSADGGPLPGDAGGSGAGNTDGGGGPNPPVGPIGELGESAYTLEGSPEGWPLFTGPFGHTLRAADEAPAMRAPALRLSAARNEREPLWLALGPGEGEVRVELTGLGPLSATVSEVRFTEGFADALVPRPPGAALTLAPERNSGIVIDLAVPEDAPAGDVEARLVLRRADRPDVEIPLQIHVFDFVLPREIHFSSQLNLSMEGLVPQGGSARDARDLLFGLHLTPANPSWPSSFRWDITWDNARSPNRCQAFWDERDEPPEYGIGALALETLLGRGWNEVGFPDAELFQFVDNGTPRPDTFCGEPRGGHEGTEAYNAAWAAWLAALRNWLDDHALLDRTYAYLQNEPQDAEQERLAAHLCRLTRAAAPGLRIAISEEPKPSIAEDAGGPCGYDIWIAALQHLQPAYALKRQRDFGEQLWLYSLDHDPEPYFNPTEATRDALHARVIPWISWRLRARGWAYYDGDRFFPEGRPNVRALALRDGFEDYEYLWLANGKAHPPPGSESALDRTVAGAATGLTDWNREPAVLQGLRDALGAYLGGERETLPVFEAPSDRPREPRYVNFQDPAGPPLAEPLEVEGRTWEKVGWGPWDDTRGLGFVGEHVGEPGVALTGYDEVDGYSELARSYVYDDWGRPVLFELALAPGRWRVRVGLGRPAHGYPGDPHNLSLEGSPAVVDAITTDDRPTLTHEQIVEVADGRLSVTFGGRSALTGEFAYTFLAWLSAEPAE